MYRQYFNILGLPPNASRDDIKRKYRLLSLQFHPDRTNNDYEKSEQFKEITTAYDVLYNHYDTIKIEMDKIFENFENFENFGFFNPNIHGSFIPDSDITQTQTQTHGQQAYRPKSIYLTKEISLEESYTGTSLPIEITRKIKPYNNSPNHEIEEETETIYITIPEGIDNNELIVVKNRGNIIDTISGHIKIRISINNGANRSGTGSDPESGYEREGLNLIYRKSITFKESLCGFSFKITHLNGKQYTINNDTGMIIHNGSTNIIPKLGFKRTDSATSNILHGDLIIRYSVKYPERVSSEVIDFLSKHLE